MNATAIRWAVVVAAVAGIGCGGASPQSFGTQEHDAAPAEAEPPHDDAGVDAADEPANSLEASAPGDDAGDEGSQDAAPDVDAGPSYSSLPDAGPLVFPDLVACDIASKLYVGCNGMPVQHNTSYEVWFGGGTCNFSAPMGVTTGNCPAGGTCGIVADSTQGVCTACAAATPAVGMFYGCPSGKYAVVCNAIPTTADGLGQCIYAGQGYWCCDNTGDTVQN